MIFHFTKNTSLAAVVSACVLFLASSNAYSEVLTKTTQGSQDGFYYSFWSEGGDAALSLEAGGRYTTQWSNSENWFGGKGWKSPNPRVVNYSGFFNIKGSVNAYLSLYGWSRTPSVEFYIVESWGAYNPASCGGSKLLGVYQTDGANYEIYDCPRQLGINPAGLYFSIRNPKKLFGAISGSIDMAQHFDAWKRAGLELGMLDYVIMATEGYQGQGSSDITVSDGSADSSGNLSSSSSSSPSSSSSNSSSSAIAGSAPLGGALGIKFFLLTFLAGLGFNLKTAVKRQKGV